MTASPFADPTPAPSPSKVRMERGGRLDNVKPTATSNLEEA